jgi:hypothetical protein
VAREAHEIFLSASNFRSLYFSKGQGLAIEEELRWNLRKFQGRACRALGTDRVAQQIGNKPVAQWTVLAKG